MSSPLVQNINSTTTVTNKQHQNLKTNKTSLNNLNDKSNSTKLQQQTSLANDLINTNSNSTTCSNSSGETQGENIKNFEAVINETLNSLSTSAEKDGYWCFKRKEGCKYLAQKPLDIFNFDNDNNCNYEKSASKYKFAYGVAKNNKHLGLVRRRVGRGGRIVLDRNSYYNKNNNDSDCLKM